MNIVLHVVLVASALVLIASVLLQSGRAAGLGAIGGGADQFFGQGEKLDRLFSKITTASAVLFMISTLMITVLQ